jgi:hypothetical protein
MKNWRYILGALALVLVIIQFIPNELPTTTTNNPGDLITAGLASPDVAVILQTSCYSCHSNETKYPWYAHVAPSSWLVANDVREGRDELNFSTWQDYDLRKKLSKLDDLATEVGEGRMPMRIYTVIHTSAQLDETQREIIEEWAETLMDSLAEEEEDEGEEQ